MNRLTAPGSCVPPQSFRKTKDCPCRKKYEKHSAETGDPWAACSDTSDNGCCRCCQLTTTCANTDLRTTIRWSMASVATSCTERLNSTVVSKTNHDRLNNNNNNHHNLFINNNCNNNNNNKNDPLKSRNDNKNNNDFSHVSSSSTTTTLSKRGLLRHLNRLLPVLVWLYLSPYFFAVVAVHANDLDKAERFLDKINEQSIAAVFNKVAYGSTTKRSIPDNAYLYTTLPNPLLTTFKYTDGNQEWYRVDVKEPEILTDEKQATADNVDDIAAENRDGGGDSRANDRESYGLDLEKDHVLPTSAPAADILKNNNNKNYNNPNRYNNDKLRPDQPIPPMPDRFGGIGGGSPVESVTERDFPKTSTGYSVLRNVRPTKSMFGKDVPSYVPPSRSFFTPPLPPEYLNPFADKPTLRGSNSDTYQNRRPIPPPSLMPKKDRIPYRPDLPPSVSDTMVGNQNPRSGMDGGTGNNDRMAFNPSSSGSNNNNNNNNNNGGGGGSGSDQNPRNSDQQRKKTLNTPSQNVHLDRLGDAYGLNRLQNETNFEYEPMVFIPSISRILSGSNGRKEDLPDILLRTVTATPNHNRNQQPPQQQSESNRQKVRQHEPPALPERPVDETRPDSASSDDLSLNNENFNQQAVASPSVPKNVEHSSSSSSSSNNNNNRKLDYPESKQAAVDTTTIISDILNLPNVKIKPRPEVSNATRAASGQEIWSISWNVHIYLVVFLYVLLAIFSIVKLVRYERENHMFSKSYFLAVHLLLTTICVLRIFYLAYDPYNISMSFGIFTYDILHNLPLSLLATTFAILIVFLLKRTLTHLKVKTRPIFLVLFSLGHMFLCFCLNLAESFDLFDRGSFLSLICRFVYVLLCWSLGLSYVYLYKIIKNVLAKKSQNLSEMCSQNISYASHITIAVALLFTLLGFVELYGLFFIKIDRFIIPQHWILWGWELSIRLLEISIITLLAIVVSLRMSQREKTNVGFPLFPCTTSDSSSDNMYPNNCNTNLNALNYSLRSSQTQYRSQMAQGQAQRSTQDLSLDNIPTDIVERPNLIDKKSTLDKSFPPMNAPPSSSQNIVERSSDVSDNERGGGGSNFERFERPNWQGSQRFGHHDANFERDNFPIRNFERNNAESLHSEQQFDSRGGSGRFSASNHNFNEAQPPSIHGSSNHSGSGSTRSSLKPYEKCRYYTKPKYDDMMMYNSSSCGGGDDDTNPKLLKRNEQMMRDADDASNLYSEPLDISGGGGSSSNNTDRSSEYERRYQELDRQDLERRSRSSWTNSGRRSTGRSRKSDRERAGRNHQAGIHTLPNQDTNASMLVDERGFLRFRQLGEEDNVNSMNNINMGSKSRKHRYHHNDLNHYSDA